MARMVEGVGVGKREVQKAAPGIGAFKRVVMAVEQR